MIPLHYSPEVLQALEGEAPVVALESTIITHGLPYPHNRDAALAIENEVRSAGATPATMAVLDGQIHVGLEQQALQLLLTAELPMKLSRADLSICLSQRRIGSTTVAATMICAELAGISVFATGGIGGVHRGAEHSFDVSADLQQLGDSQLCVVSAGAKAILDLPKTLEVLETLGVAVVAYGQDQFPAFWSRCSGLEAPLRLDTAAEIAASFLVRQDLGLRGSQLIANPVPVKDEIPSEVIEPIVSQALASAAERRISGKAVTPFLLQRVFELTAGTSLAANLSLVKNNARLAAKIAIEIHKQRGPG